MFCSGCSFYYINPGEYFHDPFCRWVFRAIVFHDRGQCCSAKETKPIASELGGKRKSPSLPLFCMNISVMLFQRFLQHLGPSRC